MDTIQGVRLDSVSVGATELSELLTGAMLHAHAKSDLPALNIVRIATRGGELTAEATDRYRLVRGSIPVYIVQNESGELSELNLNLVDVKRVIALAKSLTKRAAITLTRSGDILSVSSGGSSITLSLADSTMPALDQFLEPVSNPAALSSIQFNPKYFADLGKLSGKSGVLVTFGVAENKPMQFTIVGDLVKWQGAIMPMRKA